MQKLYAVILAEEEKTGKLYAYAMQFDTRDNIAFILRGHNMRSVSITPYAHIARDRVKTLNESANEEV